MSQPIELFGQLATKRVTWRHRGATLTSASANKAFVEITTPSVQLQLDEEVLAGKVAAWVQATIRDHLLAGKAPDGTPLPAASPATVARRRYRDVQFGGARQTKIRKLSEKHGGGTSVRESWRKHDKGSMAAQAVTGLRLRYQAARLGTFDPRTFSNDLFGLESGMLARSVFCKSKAPGWAVYFADNRTRIDSKGGSAVARVFSRVGLWSAEAMRQPEIQALMQTLITDVAYHRGAHALQELATVLRELKALEAQAEQGVPDAV
jgi:hypothetical protein